MPRSNEAAVLQPPLAVATTSAGIYPWDGAGVRLCRALTEDSVLGHIFGSDPDNLYLRKCVKKAHNRVLRLTRGGNVGDDTQFAALAREVLSLPRARSILFEGLTRDIEHKTIRTRAGSGRELLATCLYGLSRRNRAMPDFESVCELREGKHFIRPLKFGRWLDENPAALDNVRDLVLFGAAFAILQPADGAAIYQTLIDHFPEASTLLGDGTATDTGVADRPTSPSFTADPEAVTPPGPAADASRPETASPASPPSGASPASVALPPESRTTVDWLISGLKWDDLTVESFGHCRNVLHTALAEADARAEQLRATQEQISADVRTVLDAYPQLSDPEAMTAADPQHGETLAGLEARRRRLSEQAARAVNVLQQFRELSGRLADPARLPAVPAGTDLSGLLDAIERSAAACRRRLEKLTRSHTAAEEAITLLCNADSRQYGALIAESDADTLVHWGDLILGRCSPHTLEGFERCKKLLGMEGVIGAIVARLASADLPSAATLIRHVIEADRTKDARPGSTLIKATSLLTWDQLIDLVHQAHDERAVLLTLAAGVAVSDRQVAVDPLLTEAGLVSPVKDWLVAVAGADGPIPLWELLYGNPSTFHLNVVNRAHEDLMHRLNTPPGMSDTYQRLRQLASDRYFAKVAEPLRRNQPVEALRQWEALGMPERIVEGCVELHGGTHISGDHRVKTLRYVRGFDASLRQWHRCATQDRGTYAMQKTWADLLAARPTSRETDAFVELLHAAWPVDPAARDVSGAGNFLERKCVTPGLIEANAAAGCVGPQMVECWVQAVRDERVQVELYLAERLVGQLEPPPTDEAVIARLVDRGGFAVARAAQLQRPAWKAALDEAAASRRAAVIAAAGTLPDEARTLAGKAPDVADAVAEFDASLDAEKFSDAEQWIEVLRTEVQTHQRKADPERQALVAFLQSAGGGDPLAELPVLRAAVERYKRQHADRRRHIEAMLDAKDLPQPFRDRLAALANRLDSPGLYPTPEVAEYVALDLTEVLRYSAHKFAYLNDQNRATVEAMLAQLPEWLPDAVDRALNWDGTSAHESPLLKLALNIRRYWEPAQVLELLGVTVPSRPEPPRSPAEPKPSESRPDVSRSNRLALEDLIKGVRGRLGGPTRAAQDTSGEQRTDAHRTDALRNACEAGDWPMIRQLSRSLIDADDRPSHRFNAAEALTVIADAACGDPVGADAEQAALDAAFAAALALRDDLTDFADKNMFCNVLIGVTAARHAQAVYGVADTQNTRERLAAVLREAGRRPRATWVARVVSTLGVIGDDATAPYWCRNGTAALAFAGWEALTGLKDPAAPRAGLLLTLFAERQLVTLGLLAQAHGETAAPVLVRCTELYARIDANPELMDEARAAAQGVNEAMRRTTKLRPWSVFVGHLTKLVQPESAETPCRVEKEQIVRGDNNTSLLLDVSIIVSRIDWPVELTLTVGGSEASAPEQAFEFKEKQLIQNRVFTLTVKLSAGETGEFVRLPYRVTGVTLSGRVFNDSGLWTSDRVPGTTPALGRERIGELWPGAFGQPLSNSVLKRNRELGSIAHLLNGQNGLQRSAVVLGQRRIGKTSLLWQLQDMYPPRQGGVTAVFVNVAQIKSPTERERTSLRQMLFDQILRDLRGDVGKRNDGVWKLIDQHCGPRAARDLERMRPDQSLSSALRSLADYLAAGTHGHIGRIALLVDEFQNVFLYPPEQVDDVMWDLRSIVQQSPNISLVLAGSGLTKRLVESYDQALFGSVSKFSLRPLEWEEHQHAMMDLLLPRAVREQLCGRDVGPLALTRRAYDLCGGHPYYLSMLGLAAASHFGGRPLTPAMITQAADDMIRENVHATAEISAVKFYDHIFTSLDDLSPYDLAVARALLIHVVRETPPGFEWISRGRALDVPLLKTRTTERELQEIFNRLEMERVLERDPSGLPRYRMRVRIEAQALRHNALDEEDDAAKWFEDAGEST